MKILMLTPYLPYPLWSGGQIRTYNLIKNLSKKHKIYLYSFIRHRSEKEHISILKNYCVTVETFFKRPPWSLTSLTLSALTFYPLVVCMYLNSALKRSITQAIENERFDLIHAETFYVMPNIPKNNIPIILAEQTIEYLVYQHYTESVGFLPKRLVMGWDVAKIRFWEKRFWQKATRVVTMSLADKKVMQDLDPNLMVDLVPNGVDTSFFRQKKIKRLTSKKTILFVGNFKWLQNREAATILIKDVWPKIKKKLPETRLWIVGRYPPKLILKFASDSVKISDNIDDIRQVYNITDVLLAPIYGPGGTRYKILESMATGIPVVTTPTGIEGIGAIHKETALTAESPDELAAETINVLTDVSLYSKLAENGRKLVEEKFNWQKITDRLDHIYKDAACAKKN